MTITKPKVENGVTRANAELFNEYGTDIETIANTMLGTGAITESQLATGVAKRLVPTGGSTGQYLKWKENGTAEWSAGAGGISKAEAETLAQEAVKKAELPGAVAVVTSNITLSGIPAKANTDEVTVVEGNIVLAPFQTNEKERGLWEVKAGAWVRPTGFENGKELALGVTVAVAEGKEYRGSIWDFANKTRVIVGTTAQVWNDNSAGGSIGASEIETKVHLRYSFQGGSMGIGPGAGEKLLGLSRIEQEKHNSHLFIGENAGANVSGIIEGPVAFGANLASGGTEFTTPTGKTEETWHINNVPNVTFSEVTPGCGLETETLYWVVAVANPAYKEPGEWAGKVGTKLKLVKGRGYPISDTMVVKIAKGEALTKGEEEFLEKEGLTKAQFPTLVKLTGEMKTATTKAILSLSTEDNVLIGRNAGFSITTGGGNCFIGERAGYGAKTAEENLGIGVEALAACATGSQNIGLGQEALKNVTSGFANLGIGYKAGMSVGAGNRNVFLGPNAGEGSAGSDSVGVGYRAMVGATGEGYAVVVGQEAGTLANTGSMFLGCNAGQETTGTYNMAIGTFLAKQEQSWWKNASTKQFALGMYLLGESQTVPPLLTGEFPNAKFSINAEKIGLFKVAPVSQPKTTGTTTGVTVKGSVFGEEVEKSTFTGGKGATAYTISDIVLALKQIGALAE